MLFSLKRIVIDPLLSGDSIYFKADLYINGQRAGLACNDGQGSATTIDGFDKKGWELIMEAEMFCRTLPPITIHELIVNGASLTIRISPAYYVDKIISWLLTDQEAAIGNLVLNLTQN